MPHVHALQVPNPKLPKVSKMPSNGKEKASMEKEMMSKLMKKGIKEELSEAERAMLVAGMNVFNEPVKTEPGIEEKMNKIKIAVPVEGKAKLIEPEVKNEELHAAEVRELKMKLTMAQERVASKVDELQSSKAFASTMQAEHEKDRLAMLATIEDLRTKLSASTVKASHLEGQLLVMKELTTLTKENASSSMSILYDKLRAS